MRLRLAAGWRQKRRSVSAQRQVTTFRSALIFPALRTVPRLRCYRRNLPITRTQPLEFHVCPLVYRLLPRGGTTRLAARFCPHTTRSSRWRAGASPAGIRRLKMRAVLLALAPVLALVCGGAAIADTIEDGVNAAI